jgi:hypothetical protein
MDVRNLSSQQAANKNLVRITGFACCLKDCPTVLVVPPITVDRRAGHCFGQIRPGSMSCFEYNPVSVDELYGIQTILSCGKLEHKAQSLSPYSNYRAQTGAGPRHSPAPCGN